MWIHGNHGELCCDRFGVVLGRYSEPNQFDTCYADLVRFDVDEYEKFVAIRNNLLGPAATDTDEHSVDILDIGYWALCFDNLQRPRCQRVSPSWGHRFNNVMAAIPQFQNCYFFNGNFTDEEMLAAATLWRRCFPSREAAAGPLEWLPRVMTRYRKLRVAVRNLWR